MATRVEKYKLPRCRPIEPESVSYHYNLPERIEHILLELIIVESELVESHVCLACKSKTGNISDYSITQVNYHYLNGRKSQATLA